MTSGFGSILQNLPGGKEKVLAAGLVVEARAENGSFNLGQLDELFDLLKVPSTPSMHEYLRRLAKEGLVRKRNAGGWSVTPNGHARVEELVGDIDVERVGPEQLAAGSAELDGVQHPLILPEFAPIRFREAIERLLKTSDFERNVFCMTRFPDKDAPEDEPLRQAISAARDELGKAGLTMHLASDRQADDELFGNVVAHIWGCKFGLAFLETLNPGRCDGNLNDNVLIEIGAMLVSGRRCCLLKDFDAPKLPTDFIAQIYKDIELADTMGVAESVGTWIRDDLQLSN
jgi:hypothetical protein